MVTWLKAPDDRDIIARWTAPADGLTPHALALPQPPDPGRFSFLALGDTGDSEGVGTRLSPQDAVAQQLAMDAATPPLSPPAPKRGGDPSGSPGHACLVLHVGDVVYMAGERRLYDRNFRRPFAPFLTSESTIDQLVFRLPFLPVPGNHDYYDVGGWARLLGRIPFLGALSRAAAHEIFAFSLPEGGSDRGRTYMEAFVDLKRAPHDGAIPYLPCEYTRLPNRYYRFRVGSVDFFALDSNTLEAPPSRRGLARSRAQAAHLIRTLEKRSDLLQQQLLRDQRALAGWQRRQWDHLARDPARLAALPQAAAAVASALDRLKDTTRSILPQRPGGAASVVSDVRERWSAAVAALAGYPRSGSSASGGRDPASRGVLAALETVTAAADAVCELLRRVTADLGGVPIGEARAAVLAAHADVEAALRDWEEACRPEPPPEALCRRLRDLNDAILDVQRELALMRRRRHARPEDYDTEQLRWLDAGLAEAMRERPDGWRIVYMHHPLYTTIVNHAERPDVRGVRENLLPLLRDRAHMVLGGHSHAFEWLRSHALPHAGLVVTGGGGQIGLRRSLLDPRFRERHRSLREALREAGLVECAVAGRGPAAEDGERGPLHHYLQVEVTPRALFVRPIGVRRLASESHEWRYRREAPMPAFHATLGMRKGPSGPSWQPRVLEGVEVRRDQPPTPQWSGERSEG